VAAAQRVLLQLLQLTHLLPTFLLSPCCVLVIGQVAAMTLDTQNAVMPPPSGVNHP